MKCREFMLDLWPHRVFSIDGEAVMVQIYRGHDVEGTTHIWAEIDNPKARLRVIECWRERLQQLDMFEDGR